MSGSTLTNFSLGWRHHRRCRPAVTDVLDALLRVHPSHDPGLGHHLRRHLQHRVPSRHPDLEVQESVELFNSNLFHCDQSRASFTCFILQ